MKQEQLKAFGIRGVGLNELVFTNDQVRSLWFLTKRDYDFKKKKMVEAEAVDEYQRKNLASDGFCDHYDLSALQWQLNNAAYLAYVVGQGYSSAVVLTPEMKKNHETVLAEIAGSIKPLERVKE